MVHHALPRWLVTQGERPRLAVATSGLVADRRLHRRRAPGLTCLSALGASESFGAPARNNSKGCGTIMRVAPLASLDRGLVRALAIETSALTHGHPTGQPAAAAWALVLDALAAGDGIEAAATSCLDSFEPETELRAPSRARCAARRPPRNRRDPGRRLDRRRGAVDRALRLSLRHRSRAGLTIAVTHSGDSDSTGAIAGNALGLIFPDQVLGHRWATQVECADLIAKIADDLAFALTEDAEDLWDDYPGW